MSTRNYDREFKLNEVKLYRENQKPTSKISKDLEIPISTFSGWVKEFESHGEESFPGSGKLKPCNEQAYLLKKQLADVNMKRDILKKP
jgi:transposase